MKIKHLTMTLACVFFLSAAYCQDSTLHQKKRNTNKMHKADTSWNHNNSMKQNRNRADTATMHQDRMNRPNRKARNSSPSTDSLKR